MHTLIITQCLYKTRYFENTQLEDLLNKLYSKYSERKGLAL